MNEWKTVRLGDVCEKGSSNIAQNEIADNNGEYPIYGAAGFIKNVDFYKQDKPYIGIVKDGAGVGRVSVHPAKSSLIGTMQYIFPKENIDIKFLAEFLKYQNLSRFYTGATIPHIYFKDYQNIPLKLPSLQKQKHISAVLGKCAELTVKNKRILEKYDTLIKSRFIEMFGDNPIENGKWKVEKLGNLGLCKNGMNFSYEDNGFEINCLGVGDFKDNAVISNCEKLPVISLNEKPSEEYLLKDNDIVFVRSNGNKELVGRSVLVHPRVLTTFSGFCIRFRLSTDSINHLFLLQFLKMPNTRKNMAGRGANIQNLNQQILSNLDIPVPQIELQNDFASFVQQIDKSKFAVQKALEKAETLYKSLMQQYFA
ncbi:restriction endonuclease subunit S [uncultured Treponema sp.]|uniref:restriction endonuclease subunit S n=1 Tax=uncultured Treponema sp. TaxID=162155 RepID=UPI002804E5AA|nr:restriction endonuclease subunit S [uncultured Treponema sp.]